MAKIEFKATDFKLVDVKFELGALSGHLEYIEEAVEDKKEESRRKTNQELKSRDLDLNKPQEAAEYQHINESHHWRVESRIPRILVHPFVVAAWSTYESGAKQMAENFEDLLSPRRELSDINEKYFCKELDVFLSQIDVDAGFRDRIKIRLHQLVEFRNAIAHQNARRSGLDKFRKDVADSEADYVGPTPNNKYFSIKVDFARKLFNVVKGHLNHLMEEYRALKQDI